MLKHLVKALITIVLSCFVGAPLASAVDFSGKTIEWIIPFEAGGGSDEWAKFYAPLLSEALPGKPKVEIRYITGGGSTKGANYFANDPHVKPNGLTILGTSGSTQFPYLLGDSRVQYNYDDWHVLLITPTSGVVSISPETGVSQAINLKYAKVPLVYGSQGITSLDLVPLLAFEMLGLNVESLIGLKGRAPSRKEFERGVVNIDYQTSAAHLVHVVPLIKSGKATPIMSWGVLDDKGNIVRDPTFPNLPTFKEVYEEIHGQKPSGPEWRAWKTLFVAGFSSQKKLFLPKGTPNSIVDVYTQAFTTIMSNPSFAIKAEKYLGRYSQKTGQAANELLNQSVQVDSQTIDWIKAWVYKKYGMKLG